MRTICLFILGAAQFRSSVTPHFDGYDIEAYDSGRDFAHRITLRRFDA